jgi:hypothetical protein
LADAVYYKDGAIAGNTSSCRPPSSTTAILNFLFEMFLALIAKGGSTALRSEFSQCVTRYVEYRFRIDSKTPFASDFSTLPFRVIFGWISKIGSMKHMILPGQAG